MIQLVILDPGHFHASLLQKRMYPQVSPVVHVYAPEGPELQDYLARIDGFNSDPVSPTHWETRVHASAHYLNDLLSQRWGSIVITAGNNLRKSEYLKAAIDGGFHVLGDKPLCINSEGWLKLRSTLETASAHRLLLYDIMTERFEITSILQREFVQCKELFGDLLTGSPAQPSIIKESVHHLSKSVAGRPLKRPAWYFDVAQQGDGIVDVTTHLVDLVMWICFPGIAIQHEKDIELLQARRWPTKVSRSQFEKVTRQNDFPEFLYPNVHNGVLHCYCNGEISYTLKGNHVKIAVAWNFEAPEGGGDTHESRIRGSNADVVVHQGEAQRYQPELYLEPHPQASMQSWADALRQIVGGLTKRYSGLELRQREHDWHLFIPDRHRRGHEAHFSQVAENFLQFLESQQLPDWEVPNMIAKYYTTTKALDLARSS